MYLEDDAAYEKFTETYPNILPSINALLSFNIFVLLGFIAAFFLTFRYDLKIFYMSMAGYICLYLGKFICSLTSLTIEPDMNSELSEWYE